MSEWQNRPLDPVVFIDAINVKIRDGNVANRPIYIALGVTVDGARDVFHESTRILTYRRMGMLVSLHADVSWFRRSGWNSDIA